MQILNEKKQPRRPQLLDLQSDALNQVMIEAAQKRIGFLGTVKSTNVTQRKLDLVESVRVVINERDGDKAIQRETIVDKGKVEENQIRRIYNFEKKMEKAKDEIMSTQLAQRTLHTEPIDDSYMQ